MQFKEFIAKQMIGKKLHFKCDCLFPIDTVGTIMSYVIENNEIIFKVAVGNKFIDISENHPKLNVAIVNQ